MARKLHLSKVTISAVVDELLADQLIIELGAVKASSKGGRKPVPLALNGDRGYVIGLDIGTTNLVAAVSDITGSIKCENRVSTDRNHALDAVLDQLTELISSLIADAGIDRETLFGVGVSTAGLVQRTSGFVKKSSEFHWDNIPLQDILGTNIGLPIVVDNCTRAMTLGEIYYGDAIHDETVFYVNVGYGIGSAIVIHGKIYDSHSEFGHIIIRDAETRCNCGKYGCLTTLSSGHAIERMANGNLRMEGNRWITAKMAAEMAEDGNEKAREIFKLAGTDLGHGIAIAANLLNPDRIIIGGGVAGAGDILMSPLRLAFEENAMEIIKEDVTLQTSQLGMEAGILGAVALGLNTAVFRVAIDG